MRALLAGLALLSLTACSNAALRTAGREWHEVRTARFRIWTEGKPEEARQLVLDLERFHQVMLAMTSAEERVGAPPLRILLARDVKSLKALTGVSTANGLFNTSVQGNFAFVALQGEEPEAGDVTSRHVLFHEYTHYVVASAGSRVPSWYHEGFAEYMATTAFRENGSYTLGCPPQYRTRWTEYARWIPIGKVMEAPKLMEIRNRKADSYAQSWYAVHFFNQDSARQQQLARYLELWGTGTQSEQAAKQAFGVGYDELDEQLQAYAARESFDCLEIQPAKELELAEVEVRPLSKAEAYYRIGAVLVATGMDLDRAREVLEQALTLEPGYADALGVLGHLHLIQASRRARGDDAIEADLSQAQLYLHRAQELVPDSAERFATEGSIHSFKARLAMDAGDQTQARSELAEARRAFRKAIHRDETLALAYVGLGTTYLVDDDGAEEGQVVLEAAAYLVPLEPWIALLLAKLHIQRKQHAQAIAPLEHVLLWGRPEVRAEGTKLMAQARKAAAAR